MCIRDRGIDPVADSNAIESTLKLADKLKEMGSVKAMEWGKGAGFDAGDIHFLTQGSDEIKKAIEEQKELAIVSQKDGEQAIKRQIEWNKLVNTIENIGRSILNTLSPKIVQISKALKEWIQSIDMEMVNAQIDRFTNMIDDFKWEQAREGGQKFLGKIMEIVDAVVLLSKGLSTIGGWFKTAGKFIGESIGSVVVNTGNAYDTVT